MKRLPHAVMMVLLLVWLAGCGQAVTRTVANQWLDTFPQESPCDVSGQWRGPTTGWGYWGMHPFGTMVLIQEGTRISGTYAEHEIIGTISGMDVYLVGLYKNTVRYTWFMRYVPKVKCMIGKMCDRYTEKVEPYCYPLTLQQGM